MDTPALAPHHASPGSAAALTTLMALYESNYRRLQRLLPERDFPLDAAVSCPLGPHASLHLSIDERCRYTQTLRLCHHIAAGGCAVQVPEQRLRVYHDAGLVEALPIGTQPEAPLAALGQRQLRNRQLNQWLRLWLEQGHGFLHQGRPRLPG